VLHRGAVVAALVEQLHRHGQQRLQVVAGPAPTGRGAGRGVGGGGHDAPGATDRLRPRNSAMISSPRRTGTSEKPFRPYRVRISAAATSSSPSRALATNEISAPAPTVTAPWVLQAQANAVSASM